MYTVRQPKEKRACRKFPPTRTSNANEKKNKLKCNFARIGATFIVLLHWPDRNKMVRHTREIIQSDCNAAANAHAAKTDKKSVKHSPPPDVAPPKKSKSTSNRNRGFPKIRQFLHGLVGRTVKWSPPHMMSGCHDAATTMLCSRSTT